MFESIRIAASEYILKFASCTVVCGWLAACAVIGALNIFIIVINIVIITKIFDFIFICWAPYFLFYIIIYYLLFIFNNFSGF